jgi:hypothetical protein
MVRNDDWEPRRWELSCDPHAGWDWRIKLGRHNTWAVHRLRMACEARTTEQNRQRKMQRLRALVDMMHP